MERVNWSILAKTVNDEPLNKKEKEELDGLDKKELKLLVDETKASLANFDIHLKLRHYNTNKAWGTIEPNIQGSNRTFKGSITWLKVAAAVLILIASSVAIWQYTATDNWFDNYQTAKYSKNTASILLADGTTVTLNNQSKLIYPKSFEQENRTVILKGEAFFDVTPNLVKPFIVSTKHARVKVLGTSFKVAAHPKSAMVEVLVKTGIVELSGDEKEPKKVILNAGDKGTYNQETSEIKKENNYDNNKLAWVTQDIIFDKTPLSEIVNVLVDVYDVEITVGDRVNSELTLTSTFSHQNIEHILGVVGTALDLQIIKSENQFTITSSNQ